MRWWGYFGAGREKTGSSAFLLVEDNVFTESALRSYLIEKIFPCISPPPYGEIEVRRLAGTHPVFLCIETKKNLPVVGKSFRHGDISDEEAWTYAYREYTNLRRIREEFGMRDDSYNIVEPLGTSRELAALLVTRQAPGKLLEYYISRAIYDGRREKLFDKLGHLARFFARLHGNTATSREVSPTGARVYLERLTVALRKGPLSERGAGDIERLSAAYWNKRELREGDTEVIIHGDATPTNFLLQGEQVTGIDLEKMQFADRSWDLGFMAAELKHHFLWRTGDRWAGEPFIGHFLWEYASRLGGRRFFQLITAKLPLYIALGLLRITRNCWLDEGYRRLLIEEAKQCLEFGR